MKTLYVTDLDGTLLEPDKSIKPDNLKLINQLIDEDVNITYATARSLTTAKQVIGDINFKLPVIVQNGTFILSPEGDVILGNYLGDSILDTVKNYDISPIVYSQRGKNTYFSYIKDKMSAGVKTFVDDHLDDPRNHLYKSYVEVVKKVHPIFFVMENVKGMLSVAEQVKEDFRAIGYSVECHILNAKNFGVPQNRERLIYIGNCLGVDNEQIFNEIFALSENIPEHNLGDALFALRELKASRVKNSTESGSIESGYKIEKNNITETNDYISYINQDRVVNVVSNHKARYNNDRDIEIYGRMEPGDRSDDPKIADIMPYARRNGIFKDKYFKLENDKVCKTITAHMKFDCNMYIHPTQARGLTPREAARVQSYPDDYFFRGAYTKTYMQIGNSVPPLLGRAIAQVIKRYMKGGNV